MSPSGFPVEAPTANGVTVNGVDGASWTNGSANRPHTPQSSLSLTEYSAKPSPPSEDKSAKINKVVPAEFLLPNGRPDVSSVPRPASYDLPFNTTSDRLVFLDCANS